ncbi:HAMP domain-containing histidine kinase [Amycolatopsis acidicola]|uniref:histidine kinase n=1 Tax=Amycolatopsis acidicola TaxID=2596893 RepID=A0A5N0V4H4_9PSEU|nr:HAMP domain-containing sensor histidine kinase [Amycolatopsis acidicola]KAA9161319.1 HAMP domain-containing histidine kinase [Amycolatopsis acidicola]
MRARLLPIVLSLVVLVLLGMGIPLALSLSDSEEQSMFLDRIMMTSRLASLAQRPLLDGHDDLIGKVLARYEQVYGVAAIVLDQDGVPQASAPSRPQLTDPGVQSAVTEALAGRQPQTSGLFLPWDSRPLVLAEPVMVDGEVRGAVVTVSPTGALREIVLVRWAVIGGGGLVALIIAILLALPLVQWILRPIRRLDEAAGRVVVAVTEAAAVQPAATNTGPPELRKLARSFDDMAAGMSDVLAAQRAFVADASHQLRNPLTALSLRLSNLDDHVAPEAAGDHAAAVAEAQRLNDVLDGLLTLARTEASAAGSVVIDATAALEDRVNAWRPVAAARDVELRSEVAEGLSVYAVPRAVGAILDALLDNAVKFSAGQGPGATVEVAARHAGRVVSIAVRDHGPGLNESELDRATDRFWRSPSKQNVSGSGLGLAIVRNIVDRSRGTLRLDLPDGGGLRISVELPSHPLT